MSTSRQQIVIHAPRPAVSITDWVQCGLVFALLWLLLTKGNSSSWIIGIFVVPAATWCAMVLFRHPLAAGKLGNSHRPAAIQILAVPGFIPFFLWQSLRGGWESALFAINSRKRLRQGFIRYSTGLPQGRPRLFFLHLVSLLPGTVSADWQGERMLIHALDTRSDNHQALRHCEVQTARLFGLSLTNTLIKSTSSASTSIENGGVP